MEGAPTTGTNSNAVPPVTLSLDHVSPATRLLEKRKQMLQVEAALDAQKAEYARKEDLFRRREENLRKKDLELQEALVLFNKFLKENEAKRRRADRRAESEIDKREEAERTLAEHRDRLRQKEQECSVLKEQVAQNEQYVMFLKQVQKVNHGEFTEPDAILNRYKCLTDAHQDLMQRQRTITEQIESLRQEYVTYAKDAYTAQLGLNNKIASLSKELELMLKTTANIEDQMEDAMQLEADHTLKINQVIMAINNLYERCKSSKAKVNHTKTVEAALAPGASDSKASSTGTKSGGAQSHNGPASNTNGSSVSGGKGQAAMSKSDRQRQIIGLKMECVGHYLADFASIVGTYGSLPGTSTQP